MSSQIAELCSYCQRDVPRVNHLQQSTLPSNLLRCLRRGSYMCTQILWNLYLPQVRDPQISSQLCQKHKKAGSFSLRMSEPIWSAICGDIRLRHAVHFSSLERPLPEVRHSSQAHHGLSSTGQWPVRAIPQVAEGIPQSKWYSHLPWVMMGLRTTPKEDYGLSSAKMVYGEPLALPDKFLDSTELPSASFLQQLRQQMSSFLQPQQKSSPYLPPLLQEQFVYIKRGAAASSLTSLYAGPYRAVERRDKYFYIDLKGRKDAVSTDRFKPHLGDLHFSGSPAALERPAADFSATAGMGG
jgi:hypothetical protein